MHLIALLLLTAGQEDSSPPQSKVSFVATLGSSHWVGQTFGTPLGISTPSLSIAVHPGLEWLEVGLRYSLALLPLALPNDGGASRVGFVSVEVLLTKELRVGTQRLALGVGPAGAVVHSGLGAGFGVGPVFVARYLFDVTARAAVGPYFAMRPMFYGVPGDAKLLAREDLQGDLGVVAVF